MIDIYEKFKSYVSNYNYNNPEVVMKYNHSMRVANHSKKIAESLNFNKEDLELIEKCGLLHDIARFKQIIEFNTFTDHISFDHGDMGEIILKANDYISEYETNKEKQNLILATIKNHNKLEIEDGLDEKTLLFCKIIRDADKIDILLTQGLYKIDGDNIISDAIYKSFKNHVMVKNEYIVSKVDSLLRQVAFIFDLEFKESFKILKEKETFSEIFEYLRKNSNSKYIDEIEYIVNEYIKCKTDT